MDDSNLGYGLFSKYSFWIMIILTILVVVLIIITIFYPRLLSIIIDLLKAMLTSIFSILVMVVINIFLNYFDSHPIEVSVHYFNSIYPLVSLCIDKIMQNLYF